MLNPISSNIAELIERPRKTINSKIQSTKCVLNAIYFLFTGITSFCVLIWFTQKWYVPSIVYCCIRAEGTKDFSDVFAIAQVILYSPLNSQSEYIRKTTILKQMIYISAIFRLN